MQTGIEVKVSTMALKQEWLPHVLWAISGSQAISGAYPPTRVTVSERALFIVDDD